MREGIFIYFIKFVMHLKLKILFLIILEVNATFESDKSEDEASKLNHRKGRICKH